MNQFQFNATDVFGLQGRSIVFRGRVVSGSLGRGERVKLRTRSGDVTAGVTFITSQSSSESIPETVRDQEINLLLANFDLKRVNRAINSAGCDECDPGGLPPPAELLNIELPCVLEDATV